MSDREQGLTDGLDREGKPLPEDILKYIQKVSVELKQYKEREKYFEMWREMEIVLELKDLLVKEMIKDGRTCLNEKEILAVLKSSRPIEEFDDETGIFLPFMKMNCCFCNHEQSMLMLLDEKGKPSINDFYCRACNIGHATEEPMKRYIDSYRKEAISLLKFPDEKFGANIDMMKEYQPNIMKRVSELIEAVEARDPFFTNLANDMRHTKTYRAYPRSLGDENRLFMTISSYFERFGHRFEGKNGDQELDEFTKLVKQDQA